MDTLFHLSIATIAFLVFILVIYHITSTDKLNKQIQTSRDELIEKEKRIRYLTQKERFYRSLLHDLEAGQMKQDVFPIPIMNDDGVHTLCNLSQLSIFMAGEGTFLFSEYSHTGYDENGYRIFEYLPKDHEFNMNLHRYLFLPAPI